MSLKSNIKTALKLVHQHKKSEPDIFIFTLPRAGSTLLSEILNTIPNAKTAGEPFALNNDNKQVLQKYFKKEFLEERYGDMTEADFKNFILYFNDLSEGKLWNSYNWADLKTQHHSLKTNRTIFKTHKVCYFFDDIMRTFPEDKGIYLLRNPVSQALSRIRNGWHTYIDFYETSKKIAPYLTPKQKECIEVVKKSNLKIDKFILSWCFENYTFLRLLTNNNLPHNITWVKYEEIVSNTVTELQRLCLNLGVEYTEAMNAVVKQPSKGIVHSTVNIKQQISAGNTQVITDRWKKKISEEELKVAAYILETFSFHSVYNLSSD